MFLAVFIDLRLRWVFTAARGLSFWLWRPGGYSLVSGCGLLTAVASRYTLSTRASVVARSLVGSRAQAQ